jgi:hypothetical protein
VTPLAVGDLATAIGALGGVLAIVGTLWKGIPELRKAGAERDAIVADTYQQVIKDVTGEMTRLRDEARAAHADLVAARAQIDELKDQLRREHGG